MAKKKIEAKMQGKEKTEIAGAECSDVKCPFHGRLKARGRIFQGTVIKKENKKVTIEFGRNVYIRKYERFAKQKTKIHAHLPNCMINKINIGDYIKVQECRPLSKIIHAVVIEKIRDVSEQSSKIQEEVEDIKEELEVGKKEKRKQNKSGEGEK